MPPEFIQPMVLYGIRVDEVERGRILCSYAVPPRLLNAGNSTLHGGAIVTLVDLIGAAAISSTGAVLSGVAIDIGVSYLDGASVGEEIEIEAKALKVGRGIGVVTVEFRRKRTRKVIALGRHTTYLFASSKL
ncbi:hypothetical protein M569_11909 [Genlisea aurea]|uniref:Acyl-coenzyme A thioesterase 13 n=1 Tax=Genlisea aurea TaxID=192259 RepID=S8C810_9LAMI|nr:hypothetical protein M569_11909 [Genlisea aurea]